MSVFLSLAFPLVTGGGPMDAALRATEAPDSLRAAFTVEMTSAKASRTYTFDPREPEGRRWRLVIATGEDGVEVLGEQQMTKYVIELRQFLPRGFVQHACSGPRVGE